MTARGPSADDVAEAVAEAVVRLREEVAALRDELAVSVRIADARLASLEKQLAGRAPKPRLRITATKVA